MMINKDLNIDLQKDFDLITQEKISIEELQNILTNHINELIQKDFSRLIFLLYKIDVNEEKLKYILKEKPDENTGKIIAQLIIEREQQKIESRNFFNTDNKSEEEKW